MVCVCVCMHHTVQEIPRKVVSKNAWVSLDSRMFVLEYIHAVPYHKILQFTCTCPTHTCTVSLLSHTHRSFY